MSDKKRKTRAVVQPQFTLPGKARELLQAAAIELADVDGGRERRRHSPVNLLLRQRLIYSIFRLLDPDVVKCRRCGCSEFDACRPDGCHWVDDSLCSSCVEGATE